MLSLLFHNITNVILTHNILIVPLLINKTYNFLNSGRRIRGRKKEPIDLPESKNSVSKNKSERET